MNQDSPDGAGNYQLHSPRLRKEKKKISMFRQHGEEREREAGRSKLRDAAKNIAVMLGSTLLFLFLLEIIVRIVEPREIMRYFFLRKDPILHHKFIANASGHYETTEFNTEYSIDSLGLRDTEFPAEKPANTFRILMLGDSFTEGDGVNSNETFSKRLEFMLNSTITDYRYHVINAGVGSYSPILEYIYLKRYGLQLNPDLVVLNFDLSDIHDDIYYTSRAIFDENGAPVAVHPETEPQEGSWLRRALVNVKDFFKEHAQLYNFIRIRISQSLDELTENGNHSGDIRVDKYAMLRENSQPPGDQGWTLSYKYILMIRDLLSARGIGFWVTVYPYGLQVSPREWNSGRRFWGFKSDTLYSTKPQKYVEDFCKRNNIPVINMCDDFRKASRSVYPLYYDYNGHWRAAGHELAAQILYRELQQYLQTRRHIRSGVPSRVSPSQTRSSR
jgi:hypothetical protein